ncbi:RETSAT [Lepeophtheirus salmonis]|uniref:RETSAT n=1 Tax=Lepeophtheirus salmonis TaxID=72036 RepID=A0A7R8CHS3_LEPSM|nr:RETSAT [Lepeophtheirus salmonis]CAF2771210.1 RETSAT [Lepeophtheirus salmonis]
MLETRPGLAVSTVIKKLNTFEGFCFYNIYLSIKIAIALSSLFLFVQIARWRKQAQYKNPFESKISRKKPGENKKKRRFDPNELPPYPEAIFIGSGTSSLMCANIMSRSGYKNIVILESHDTEVGGSTHVFNESGFEFDVGIHYIGEMTKRSLAKSLVDTLTENNLEWEDMGDPFDCVYTSKELHPVHVGLQNWKEYLLKKFPKETYLILELFGLWNDKIYRTSVKDLVESLTQDKDLQKLMCYSWADYGTPPNLAPWAMQALIFKHFGEGGAYPVGGSSRIAECLIPPIEEAGGKVFCNAPVSEILYNGSKVMGVRVMRGSSSYDIKAPLVVSGAGIRNTFNYLLPPTDPGMSMMSIFLGFDKAQEELQINKSNIWAHFGESLNSVTEFLGLRVEDIVNSKENQVPLLFISFPSTKDSSRLENEDLKYKSSCTLIGPANWEWFSKWDKYEVKKRGDEYNTLKSQLGQKYIDRLLEIFPSLQHHISYVRMGSPVTNKTYLGSPFGEIYGLDHTIERFHPNNIAKLRPKTDIPGLYLTGQDVLTCGFVGAAFSGVLTANSVLDRNIMNDLLRHHQRSAREKDAKKDK